MTNTQTDRKEWIRQHAYEVAVTARRFFTDESVDKLLAKGEAADDEYVWEDLVFTFGGAVAERERLS